MLKTVFSIAYWARFLDLLVTSVFPVTLVPAALAFFKTRLFRHGPAARLIFVFLAAGLGLRFLIFFGNVPFEKRYLYSLLPAVFVFAAPGVIKLSELALSAAGRFGLRLSGRKCLLSILVIAAAVCLAKGLNPAFDKGWMRQIPLIIKKETPPGMRPSLITDSSDPRVAYYSGADYYKLSLRLEDDVKHRLADGKTGLMPGETKRIYGIIASRGVNEYCGTWVAEDMPYGIEHLAENIRALGGARVFVLMCSSDADFKRKFQERGVPFPLRFLGEFKAGGKDTVSLYQGID
jgi:hypothetical protein